MHFLVRVKEIRSFTKLFQLNLVWQQFWVSQRTLYKHQATFDDANSAYDTNKIPG